MLNDLDGLTVFVAVADAKGFSAAAKQLGVSTSAVSQAVRKLEQRRRVSLVQRTTRSVRLTEAGEQLYNAARPAIDGVRAAITSIAAMGDEPRGTLRLYLSTAGASLLGAPMIASYLKKFPHVRLELPASDEVVDIVARGYDAGLHLGEVIDRDMVGVPVTGDVRLTVVGSPKYFAKHPKPSHPRELVHHQCINWQATPTEAPYRWEFTERGRDFSVEVRARVVTTDLSLMLRLAREGVGLTMVYESQARRDVLRGDLVPVLQKYCAPFSGFYLYYPQRRHASPPLRAFVDHLKAARKA